MLLSGNGFAGMGEGARRVHVIGQRGFMNGAIRLGDRISNSVGSFDDFGVEKIEEAGDIVQNNWLLITV